MPCMQLTCASLPDEACCQVMVCLILACVRPWISISPPHARRSLILTTTQDNPWTWYTHAWADTILLILAQVWSSQWQEIFVEAVIIVIEQQWPAQHQRLVPLARTALQNTCTHTCRVSFEVCRRFPPRLLYQRSFESPTLYLRASNFLVSWYLSTLPHLFPKV